VDAAEVELGLTAVTRVVGAATLVEAGAEVTALEDGVTTTTTDVAGIEVGAAEVATTLEATADVAGLPEAPSQTAGPGIG
jgi:hypothetical protein